MAIDGSINGARFLDYVSRVLAPTLKPGDIVIIDNLSSHKSDEVASASKRSARKFASFRPTARTSTRSRRPSRNSRRSCEEPPPEPSKRSEQAIEELRRNLHADRMRKLLRRMRI